MHRTHADDLSQGLRIWDLASPQELTYRFARTEKLARQIHVDDTLPLFERHLSYGRVPLKTGIVDQDVDRTEAPDSLGEHRDHFAFLADVGLERDRRATGSNNLIYHRLTIRRGRCHGMIHDYLCAL